MDSRTRLVLWALKLVDVLKLRDWLCRQLVFFPPVVSYAVYTVTLSNGTQQHVMYLISKQFIKQQNHQSKSNVYNSSLCNHIFDQSDMYDTFHDSQQSTIDYPRLILPIPPVESIEYRLNENNSDKYHRRQVMYDEQHYHNTVHKLLHDVTYTFEMHYLHTRLNERICCMYIGYIDADGSSSCSTTLLYHHANSTDLGMLRAHLLDLSKRLHVNVCAYDYSGYGLSTGKACTANTYADCDAVYQWIMQYKSAQCNTLILLGQSIGSSLAIYCSAQHNTSNTIHGVILHSPLLSGLKVLLPQYDITQPKSYEVYNNYQLIKQVKSPIFILHGMNDSEVSVYNSIGLSELCNTEYLYAVWLIDNAGHNDIDVVHRQQYIKHINDFITHCKQMQSVDRSVQLGAASVDSH